MILGFIGACVWGNYLAPTTMLLYAYVVDAKHMDKRYEAPKVDIIQLNPLPSVEPTSLVEHSVATQSYYDSFFS